MIMKLTVVVEVKLDKEFDVEEGERGSGQGFPHVYNVLKCFTLETT